MREILFRGKGNRKYNSGGWYYGYLSKDSDGDYVITEIGFSRTVIPETVGQYTGLKDKNGKRIFEHDVVRRFNSKGKEIMRYIVKWCDDCCIFVLSYCGDDMGYDTDFTVFSGTELEVIGNETDNPELLKGE